MNKRNKTHLCFCGSGQTYIDCCGRFIEGAEEAATPESLMRSRYSAYCLGNENYLLKTWHPSTRPNSLHLHEGAVKWTDLEIIAAPDAEGNEATVEFVARYKQNGRAGRLRENSRFRRDGSQWFYLDGTLDSKDDLK